MASKEKWNDNLMFVKLSEHKIPDFKEVRNEDWIKYGAKNDYPDYLIELLERSSTHGAIVNGKVSYILGEGLVASKGSDLEMKAKINAYIKELEESGVLPKMVLDFEYTDGLYLEVILNKKKTDFTLEYIPFNKMRTNKEMDTFWYSNDWSKQRQDPEKTGLKEFDAFDPDNWKQGKNSTIFYFKILKPRKGSDPNVYPLPTYIGGTQSIETEIECSNYGLSEIKSGFSAGSILNFYNGIPKPEERKALKKQIRDELTGTDNSGQFIINFATSRDRGSEVVPLNGNDLPERYTNVKKDAMKSIFTSHRVSSPALFGVQQDGVAFGTAQEIAEQYELFQNTYISQRQQIIEGIINGFAKLKGIPAKLRFKPTKAITPNIFTEQTIVNALPPAAITDMVAEHVGIDLSKYENKAVVNTVETTTTQMSKEDTENLIIEEFSRIGEDRELFEVISSKPFTFESDVKLLESELQCFADDLPENEDDLTNKELKPLQIPKITKKEEKEVKENKIEIRYSYELRHNAPALKGRSREFCSNLINLDRLYTRLEIQGMTNDLGTNVWLYKGGWYSNPNTAAPTPQCRHIWKQNIVRRK